MWIASCCQPILACSAGHGPTGEQPQLAGSTGGQRLTRVLFVRSSALVRARICKCVHFPYQAQRTHVGPVLVDPGHAHLPVALRSYRPPSGRHVKLSGPQRVLPFIVDQNQEFAFLIVEGIGHLWWVPFSKLTKILAPHFRWASRQHPGLPGERPARLAHCAPR